MISSRIEESLKSSSWIRSMFEEGAKLKKTYGADSVFDFSLGNPDVEPPEEIRASFLRLLTDEKPGRHGYMSNAGYEDVRAAVAEYLSRESGASIPGSNVVMTCGAAGGLNIVLKTILNPGEEVIVFSPYFVEYLTYIENYGGVPVIVPTNPETFQPDPAVLRKSLTARTKGVIINSPNNPTGVVFSEAILREVAEILEENERRYGSSIYVLSDEPYARITYDNVSTPSVFRIFKNSVVINSFSKSLSLPGERIGYAAVNSSARDAGLLMDGLIYCNRVLGYVNAPALVQKVIAENLDLTVDPGLYKIRRDVLYNHLTELGFKCVKPQGAFYLFPKALEKDDVTFCRKAVEHKLLLVPGSGFGCPGHFRIAYCYGLETIKNSLPAFEALAKEYK